MNQLQTGDIVEYMGEYHVVIDNDQGVISIQCGKMIQHKNCNLLKLIKKSTNNDY